MAALSSTAASAPGCIMQGNIRCTQTHPPAEDSLLVEGGRVEGLNGLHSCDVYKTRDVVLTPGSAKIYGAILCAEPTTVEVAQGEVFLYSDKAMEMTNVHFVVHPGATLVLNAPALNFKRTHVTEDRQWPLFDVHGSLRLESTSRLQTRFEEGGSLRDEHGMIFRGPTGRVSSTWSIVYAREHISVGRVPPELSAEQQILKRTVPLLQRPDFIDNNSPTDHHADEAPPPAPTASSDGGLPPGSLPATEAGTFHSSPGAAPAAGTTADGAPGPNRIFRGGQLAGETDLRRMLEGWTINSCLDIPAEDAYFGGGIITIAGDVICREPTFVELTGSTVIRSDEDMLTRNVFWIVHERATVIFSAPTVILSRSKKYEVEDAPMLMVAPTAAVRFNVHGWVPAFAKGTPRDEKGLAEPALGGSTAPLFGTLHYSGNAIMAANPMADDGSSSAPGSAAGDDDDDADIGGSSSSGSSSSSSSNSGSGSSSSSSSSSSNKSNSDPRGSNDEAGGNGGGGDWDERQHPGAMLRVGEQLTKVLVSPDMTSGLFVDANDASLRLYRDFMTGPAADGDAIGDKKAPRVATLIKSDPGKMERVHKLRSEIAEEDEERARFGGKGLVRKLQGFCFWGKHGFPRAKERKKARDNLGQVYVTLTERGAVEGYVDGTLVMKEGGASWLSWLRKPKRESRVDGRRVVKERRASWLSCLTAKTASFELWATNNGLEVKRGGTRFWGINLKEDG
eukprot:g14963.t1